MTPTLRAFGLARPFATHLARQPLHKAVHRNLTTDNARRTAAASPVAETQTTPPVDAARPFMPGEPGGPYVHTKIPGPMSREYIRDLSKTFDTRNINLMTDYAQSYGNYIADPDGNMFLDVYAQIASMPIGYNNPALIQAASSHEMVNAIVNRPALGNFPSEDWAEILRTGILKVAPKGMHRVFTAMSGSDANEIAYKAAFMYRRQFERGGPHVEFTFEEMESSMNNKTPGSPELSILSFKGGFHGRLFGSLSTTRSKPIHKLDVPAFDWPQATFPKLKYPLDKYSAENAENEQASLDEVEHLIQTWHIPPAAVIVEPIQSEGGDNHASPEFFHKLQALLKKHNVLFIVDEVQTGVGATGKFWAHEHWNLPQPPDMMTFSKKAQTAGYYFSDEALLPNKPYRQFNTWMGDPARAQLFRAIINEIERLDLVDNTARVGHYLYERFEELQARFPEHFQDLRGKGQGTFIAFNSPKRDEILSKAKPMGINIGGCGASALRLRPMLIFQEHHADILVDALGKIVRTL